MTGGASFRPSHRCSAKIVDLRQTRLREAGKEDGVLWKMPGQLLTAVEPLFRGESAEGVSGVFGTSRTTGSCNSCGEHLCAVPADGLSGLLSGRSPRRAVGRVLSVAVYRTAFVRRVRSEPEQGGRRGLLRAGSVAQAGSRRTDTSGYEKPAPPGAGFSYRSGAIRPCLLYRPIRRLPSPRSAARRPGSGIHRGRCPATYRVRVVRRRREWSARRP